MLRGKVALRLQESAGHYDPERGSGSDLYMAGPMILGLRLSIIGYGHLMAIYLNLTRGKAVTLHKMYLYS